MHLKECYYIDTNGDAFKVFKDINSALKDESIKRKRKLNLCKMCINSAKNRIKYKNIIESVNRFNNKR